MAFGAGVPGTHDVYPTIDDCYRVVHMEGSNVPGTNIGSTEAEETRRLRVDIEAKCRALLIGRMWAQNTKRSSATATWLREWNLDGPRTNPHHIGRKPMTLEYLYRYALDMAYIAPPGNDETLRTFKLRVYNTLHTMAAATRESREMRIKQLHPDTQWIQVWKKLHTAWVSEEIASMWYIVLHDASARHQARGVGSL